MLVFLHRHKIGALLRVFVNRANSVLLGRRVTVCRLTLSLLYALHFALAILLLVSPRSSDSNLVYVQFCFMSKPDLNSLNSPFYWLPED